MSKVRAAARGGCTLEQVPYTTRPPTRVKSFTPLQDWVSALYSYFTHCLVHLITTNICGTKIPDILPSILYELPME